jgi:hypothetical protein
MRRQGEDEPGEQPELIKSRKVQLMTDQGAIIISTEDGRPFQPTIYAKDDGDDAESSIKDDVLSPHIWWFREAIERAVEIAGSKPD